MVFGILSAMDEEIGSIVRAMTDVKIETHGMRRYHCGKLHGRDCVAVFSRWGKVAAATTTTELICRFGVERLVFTGVAGAVAPGLSVGDIVVGVGLVQHDLDARPIFERHVVPLLGVSRFETDAKWRGKLAAAARAFAARDFAAAIPEGARREFALGGAKVHEGDIASGDRFFADPAALAELRQRLPKTLCVEMEGAAVAQVCHEYGIPFAIVRTISDLADHHAPIDFAKFVEQVASRYSAGILQQLALAV